MTEWLMTGLWTTTLSLLLVLLLRRPVTSWLGAGSAYALWLVVPMQLLASLPFLSALAPHAMELPALIVTTASETLDHSDSGGTLLQWVMSLWVAGSALMLGYLVLQIIAARKLVAGSTPVEVKGWLPTAETRPFPIERLRVSPDISTPLVAGLFRQSVLMPPNMNEYLPPETMQLVIAHEFQHAKRHDNLINFVAGLFLALFWFHPLVWAAYRAFRTDQEISCDASIIGGLGSADRTRYGHALLSLSEPRHSTALVASWSHSQSLKRRIMMLSKHRQSTFHRLAGAVFVALATGFAVAVSAGSAGNNSEPEHARTDPLPLVRIQPVYPRRAAEEGIQGFVRVELTVSEDGTPENITVLEAQPEGMFEESAIKAISEWRFQPATADGIPVSVRVVQTLEYKSDPDTSVRVPEDSDR